MARPASTSGELLRIPSLPGLGAWPLSSFDVADREVSWTRWPGGGSEPGLSRACPNIDEGIRRASLLLSIACERSPWKQLSPRKANLGDAHGPQSSPLLGLTSVLRNYRPWASGIP